jgi:hypothetical protein
MARQLQAKKEILIFGDSNVERNILHTGRLYCQYAKSIPARNLSKFSVALSSLQPNKYKLVIFAMLTNIIVATGNSANTMDQEIRVKAVEAGLKALIRDIT